jgi:prophage regulatory protein
MRKIELDSSNDSENTAVGFLRLPSVLRRTGLGRSTIYRLMSERSFPAPVKLSGRAVGWRIADVDRWSETRPTAQQKM